MVVSEYVRRLQFVPYQPGGNTWTGMDCFGLVERWYSDLLGIAVVDRQNHENAPTGLCEGYRATTEFEQIDGPRDHAVPIMKSVQGRTIVKYGHCGIFWGGNVYHIEESYGFRCQPLSEVRGRITDFRIHVDASNL